MPNKHAADKICVGVWIPRTLRQRLIRAASDRNLTLTQIIELAYLNETRDIELTAEDYRQIALETEAAQRGVDRRSSPARAGAKAGNSSGSHGIKKG